MEKEVSFPCLSVLIRTQSVVGHTAFETGAQVKSAVQTGIPILAVDVPPAAYDAMIKNAVWITDDEAWKAILSTFPLQHSVYAPQVREAVAKRKADGHHYVLLFAVREERIQLLSLL